jgi:outer membrane biosynthesis protein TonB
VRKLLTLSLASLSIVAIACSKKAPVVAMSDDLKNDLKLASTTQDIRINPDEITPTAKPQVALKVKKAPSGPKVVRTQKPTVMASAAAVEQAEIPSEVPDVQMTAPSPAPAIETAPEAPPLARPSAIPASTSAGAGADNGRVNGGSGAGSVWGAVLGAVIRGGVVGDDDHCDPRSTMPRRRPPTDIGVYSPNPMGGMRRPMTVGINPRGRIR